MKKIDLSMFVKPPCVLKKGYIQFDYAGYVPEKNPLLIFKTCRKVLGLIRPKKKYCFVCPPVEKIEILGQSVG